MNTMRFLFPFFSLTVFFIIAGCGSNSTEPEETNIYMSLSVGDIREYFDTGLEMYQIWEIKEKIK